MKLQIGEASVVKICSRKWWNSTQVEISEGEEYEFTVEGKWTDFGITKDANGYTCAYLQLFDRCKRAKQDRWFALIGSLDKNEDKYYLIGKKSCIPFNESGILYCFANDVKGFYWNNWGHVTLQLKRIK